MVRLRKRIPARTVAEAARSHSQVFHLAEKRCNEFERLPSGRLRFLFVPTLVCYAFSILSLIVLTGYALVFVATPYDLAWHLARATSRLLIQIWPSFLIALFADGLSDSRKPSRSLT